MKRKITARLLACLLACTVSLTFSCSGVVDDAKIPEQEIDLNQNATLRLSVSAKNSRTALPVVETTDFTEFTLSGKKADGTDYAVLKTWTTAAAMQEDSVEITVGTWNFVLAAKKNGAVYEKTLESVLVHSGANELAFVLELKSTGTSGTGSVEIAITLAEGQNAYYKATFANASGSGTPVTKEGQFSSEAKLSLEFKDIDVGSYRLDIFFYSDEAKKLLIGSATEYAHVIAETKSASTVALGSLDSTYAIKYFKGSDEITGVGAAGYTRHNAVVLPKASAFETLYAGYCFCGWYEYSLFTGDPVLEIAKNTVGNKNFYGKFLAKNEYFPIKQVLVEGTKKVGHELKAVPYMTDAETPAAGDAFSGEIKTYQWYLGSVPAGGEIQWTAISSETDPDFGKSKVYVVQPGDVGKLIKVEVTQAHTASLDSEKGIYVVTDSGTTITSPESTDKAAKGTLKSESIATLFNTEGFALSYNTAETAVALGSTLDAAKLVVTPAENKVQDDCGNDVVVSFALPENQTAPAESSNYVPVVIKAVGYDDVTRNGSVFVYVKAKTPLTTAIPALAEETAVPSITYGCVKFTSADSTLEYQIDGSNTTEWHAFDTAEFKKGESYFEADDKILVRTKKTDGVADTKGNPVGYIAPSETVTVTIAAKNVGKKNSVKVISIAFEGQTDILVVKTESNDGTIKLFVKTPDDYTSFAWKTEADILGQASTVLSLSSADEAETVVTIAQGALPGVYGVVLRAETAIGATYSTTVYITIGN